MPRSAGLLLDVHASNQATLLARIDVSCCMCRGFTFWIALGVRGVCYCKWQMVGTCGHMLHLCLHEYLP